MIVTNKTNTGIIPETYATKTIPAEQPESMDLKEKTVSNAGTGEVVLNLSKEGKYLAQTETKSTKLTTEQQNMINNLKNDTSLGLSK